MDSTIVVTYALKKLVDEVAKTLPFNSPAKQQIELLNGEIRLLERHIQQLERDKSGLASQLVDLKKDHADLQEKYAAVEMATDEFEEGGYVYRRTADGGKRGPFCPQHRDVRLVPVGGHQFCSKCKMPIRGH